MTGNDNNVVDTWICNCGKVNMGKFCVKCGNPCPVPVLPQSGTADAVKLLNNGWTCGCGSVNVGKFCVKCGTPQPVEEAKASEDASAHIELEKQVDLKEPEKQRAGSEHSGEESTEEENQVREPVPDPCPKPEGDNGILKKAAIGVAVLLVMICAYFMFGRKKETPPVAGSAKIETQEKTKDETGKQGVAANAEHAMDPVVKAEKLRQYAEMAKTANTQKKQDAAANERIVFLVDDVKRNGNDLVVTGHFYNGKKNRTITSVKSIQMDIVLRDMDKELLNEKNIKYEQPFIGVRIEPLRDSQPVSLDLPGRASAEEFNNYVVSVHDVHWEGIGN